MAREKFFVVVVVLLSIVSCSVKCSVMKITEELSTEMSRTTELRESDEDRNLQIELKSLWERLAPPSAIPLDDMIANEQPMTEDKRNANMGRQYHPNHEALQHAYVGYYKNQVLNMTNHTELMDPKPSGQDQVLNMTNHTEFMDPKPSGRSFTLPPYLNLTEGCEIPASFNNTRYECEAIPPICPITNEKNLTLKFNLGDPIPTFKDVILKVHLAKLQLRKIPLKDHKFLQNDDEPAADRWRSTFNRSNLKVSDRVIRSKVKEESMIRVAVYKIRNKNKTQELKLLDTKMVQASLEGMTSWNVRHAINIWGNETRKTLKLVIKVDDGKGNEIPTQNVFEMRCGNDFEKPIPTNKEYSQSKKSYTAWINLLIVELPARTEAMKGIASSMRYEGIRRNGGIEYPESSLILDDK